MFSTKIKAGYIQPILESPPFRDTKDPCPVFDGAQWHLYGSGGSSITEKWEILHATSEDIDGDWIVQKSAVLRGVSGEHIAAPGVLYEDGLFHMFVQTEFMEPSGTLQYLTSEDGSSFTRVNTALLPIPDSHEAGIYDAHPAVIDGAKYLTYAGFSTLSKDCNLYLAKSLTNEWEGPWERLGVMLDHRDVPFHNQPDDSDYEWGLEGPQLIELSDQSIILNAVCFLRDAERGKKQRVFLSHAKSISGPFTVMQPLILPTEEDWQNGENGHATAILTDGKLRLFFQARSFQAEPKWRYGNGKILEQTLLDIKSEVK
jgi:hypothetical protein